MWSSWEWNGQSNLVCTWSMYTLGLPLASEQVKFRLATGIIPGTLAFNVLPTLLSSSPHFSPPTEGAENRSLGFCYAFVQSNLICFVFCFVPL